MLFATLFLATASAADLDLEVTLPGADPVHVVLADVQPGPLPGLLLEDGQGVAHRITAELASPEPGQAQLSFVVESVEPLARGRERATVVLQPTVLARTNQAAEFSAGSASDPYSIRFELRDAE